MISRLTRQFQSCLAVLRLKSRGAVNTTKPTPLGLKKLGAEVVLFERGLRRSQCGLNEQAVSNEHTQEERHDCATNARARNVLPLHHSAPFRHLGRQRQSEATRQVSLLWCGEIPGAIAGPTSPAAW